MADLITLARAKTNIPSAVAADDATIATLITAVSRAVERFCRREFVAAAHDELYSGTGSRRLPLWHYPILSVESVRHRPLPVLRIRNQNLASNQQARVSVTAGGLTLVRVASGVKTTDTSVTFAANGTVQALANAVNALGNGWEAEASGEHAAWPSADLRSPQGALDARGRFAELILHTAELAGYQIDDRRGWLIRVPPWTDPEPVAADDGVWPAGVNNIRVQYTAGYAVVPEDVQEAAAEWVAMLFWQTRRDPGLKQEQIVGAVSRTPAPAIDSLPPHLAARLLHHRQCSLGMTHEE